MADRVHAHLFRSLVSQVGGVDAAVACITVATGESVSNGSVSKVQNGLLAVPLIWAHALEDAACVYPFSDLRSKARKRQSDAVNDPVDHIVALKEATEMITALAAAETNASPEVLAIALKEAQEAADICNRVVEQLQGQVQCSRAPTFTRRQGDAS